MLEEFMVHISRKTTGGQISAKTAVTTYRAQTCSEIMNLWSFLRASTFRMSDFAMFNCHANSPGYHERGAGGGTRSPSSSMSSTS